MSAGIVHCSHHLLLFLKRAMEFRGRVAIEGSKTKVYQVQFISIISVQMAEEKVG